MDRATREGQIAAAFVGLADTLGAEYNVVELMQRLVDACADLADASAVGFLRTAADDLKAVASTGELGRLLDLLQVRSVSGALARSLAAGQAVSVPRIEDLSDDWSDVRGAALAMGFRSLHALPLRLRESNVGVLAVLRAQPGPLTPEDMSVAQGLADIASIGIMHARTLRESDVVRQQLEHALASRVVIEQATGVLAEVHGVQMADAFHLLRDYARGNNLGLRAVAELVVSRELRL